MNVAGAGISRASAARRTSSASTSAPGRSTDPARARLGVSRSAAVDGRGDLGRRAGLDLVGEDGGLLEAAAERGQRIAAALLGEAPPRSGSSSARRRRVRRSGASPWPRSGSARRRRARAAASRAAAWLARTSLPVDSRAEDAVARGPVGHAGAGHLAGERHADGIAGCSRQRTRTAASGWPRSSGPRARRPGCCALAIDVIAARSRSPILRRARYPSRAGSGSRRRRHSSGSAAQTVVGGRLAARPSTGRRPWRTRRA